MIILHFHLQLQFKNELFHILHIIYKYWCPQKAYKYFKKLNLLLNMSSTRLIVIRTVAGGLTANPAIIGSISRAGLALTKFSETKNYKKKIEMSRFAYTTYQKILLDLCTALRQSCPILPHCYSPLRAVNGPYVPHKPSLLLTVRMLSTYGR